MKLVRFLLLALFAGSICCAQSIPPVKAKALDNSEITLPKPENRQTVILILGFSHKSGDLCKVWGKKIAGEYGADARVGYFIMPVLQSAPSLVRPMILHGMRKDAPADQLPHFVPLYSDEAAWKKLVSFSAPDDPYLVVTAPDGGIVWQAHGVYSDDMFGELKKAIASSLEKSAAAAHP